MPALALPEFCLRFHSSAPVSIGPPTRFLLCAPPCPLHPPLSIRRDARRRVPAPDLFLLRCAYAGPQSPPCPVLPLHRDPMPPCLHRPVLPCDLHPCCPAYCSTVLLSPQAPPGPPSRFQAFECKPNAMTTAPPYWMIKVERCRGKVRGCEMSIHRTRRVARETSACRPR